LRVEASSSFGRKTVKIEFRGKDGLPRTVELALRKAQEFELALKA